MRDEQISKENLIKELYFLRQELSRCKRAEQISADFFDQAPVAIHWVSPDGIILWANKAELRMLGYAQEEFFGRPIADFHVVKEVIDDILKRLANAETLNDYPAQLRCKDGSVKKVLINSNVRWEDEKFIHTRCFTRDITDHVLAMEELSRADERFRLVSTATSDVIWDWDLTVNSLSWGINFEALFGYSLNEIKPGIESWHQYLHPEDKERVIAGVNDVLAQRRNTWSDEYRFQRKDGSYVVVFDRGYAIYDQDGKPIRMIGAMIDITERKHNELVIRENEQKLRQILDAITDMVLVKGPQSKIIWANKAFRDYYGMTIEQLQDIVDAPFNDPDNTKQYIKDDAYVFQTGNILNIPEESVTRHDGEIRLFHTVKSAIRNSDGQVVMTVGLSRDVTERKLSEEELKNNVEELKLLLAVTINRESAMIALKKEVNALSLELGRAAPYDLSFLTQE